MDRRSLPDWPPHQVRRTVAPITDPRDRALAEQLTVGVVKNALHLQHLIAHHAARPLGKIDPIVQKILAIALYQLRFLTRIPPSAAVDQAVQQTRRFGRPAAAGFVNAVLRNALRNPDPALPDPLEDPVTYARLALSHPPEVFERLLALTDPQTALAIARRNNAEPPVIVRLLPEAAPEALLIPLVSVQRHQRPGFYVVQGAKQHHFAQWSRSRIAQVQDPTAAGVIESCDIQPNQTVLDRCAGRGTKTQQLAERLAGTGRLLAMDPAPQRIDALRRLAAERNLPIEAFKSAWWSELPPDAPRQFDRILVDVPCGNSGVLGRRPEARYAQDSDTLKSLEQLQDAILDDTAPAVAPGGLLIYSTCSIWPEENQQRVVAFLSRHPDFQLLEEHATLPSTSPEPTAHHDGGYVAVLRKSGGP